MKPTFGIRLLDHLAPAATLLERAVLAEEEGFDVCWFPHDTFRKNSWALMVVPIREGLARAGRSPDGFDIAGCAWVSVGNAGEAARDTIREIVAYFGPYVEEEASRRSGWPRPTSTRSEPGWPPATTGEPSP